MRSRGRDAKWRRAKPRMPSMNDSSEPVESEHHAHARDRLLAQQQPRQLEQRPRRPSGCRWRPARRCARRCRRTRRASRARANAAEPPQPAPSPVSAPSATRAGPAATSCITCGEVSWRSYQPGKRVGGRPWSSSRREDEAAVGRVVVGDEDDVRSASAVARPRRRRCRSCRCGRSRRKRCGPPETSSAMPAAAAAPSATASAGEPAAAAARRARRRPDRGRQQPERDPVRAVGALALDPAGQRRTPEARRGSTPPPGARPRRPTGGRSRSRCSTAGAQCDRSTDIRRATAARLQIGLRATWPPTPTASSARSSRARCRPPRVARGRAHGRLHGHQPGDARPRARDPARARARPARRSTRRTSPRVRAGRPSGSRRAMPERLGADGVNLLNSVRPGRLADRLPLPRPRDPALRGRPAAAAVAAGARRPRRDRGRGRPPAGVVAKGGPAPLLCSDLAHERARVKNVGLRSMARSQ